MDKPLSTGTAVLPPMQVPEIIFKLPAGSDAENPTHLLGLNMLFGNTAIDIKLEG